MPDHMTKRIRESLNRKPVTPEDELQIAIDEMARDIALIEPDPTDWAWWVGYLLEQMELQAEKRGMHADFEEMLESLYDNLIKRMINDQL